MKLKRARPDGSLRVEGLDPLADGKTHRGFGCSCDGCNWECLYEWTTEGWQLSHYKRCHVTTESFDATGKRCTTQALPTNHHSHELDTSLVARRARHGGQASDLEQRLLDLGHLLAASGLTAANILRIFDCWADQYGTDKTAWKYQKIHDEFVKPLNRHKEYDLTNCVEFLERREVEQGLRKFIQVDGFGRVEGIFFEMEGGMEDWALGGTANVVLFDPTWGTNMWNMKCCCFVGIGASGKNSILAVVLLTAETSMLFQWAFNCFSKVFRVPPAIVATDADVAIEEALGIMQEDMWPLMVHLLCVFHISKNLHKHLFALFGMNHQGWHKVVNMFWRMAKDSDVQCIDSFDAEWEHFKEVIRAEASAGVDAVEAQLVWLDDRIYRRRHKWALRFTWGHMTCGVHATQRAESNQNAVKAGLKASALVTSLVTHLENYNSTQRTRAAIADEVQRLRNARRSNSYSCAVVTSLENKLSPYAFKLLLEQEQQSLRYRTQLCSEFEEEDSDAPTIRP